MDMYDDDSFKLQEMIDSDIRSQLDVLIPRSDIPDTPTLTDLAPVDPMESMDSDLAANVGWVPMPPQLYTFSMDIESLGGLLVNPQTGIPISLAAMPSINPVITTTISDTGQGGLPIQTHLPDSPSDRHHIDLPTPSPSPQHMLVAQQPKDLTNQKAKSVKNRPSGMREMTNPVVQSSTDRVYPKPGYSYSCLIAMALKNSKTGSLPVNEIYNFMTENFPYFKTAPNGWKNSVRHNLSLNKCFEKIEKPSGNGTPKKGCLWAMNPAKVDKMDEELHKWSSKDPGAIRLSMANPERLELLEKGEMKNEEEEEGSPVVSSTEDLPEEKVTKMEATSSSDLSFDPSMQLDESLQGLELQKGIWDDLDDERLQFLGETLSSSSSSPHHGNSLPIGQSETSLSAAVSFIQCNYIYSQAQSSSELPPVDQLLAKSGAATAATNVS